MHAPPAKKNRASSQENKLEKSKKKWVSVLPIRLYFKNECASER
jgi:hypothetical protein